MRFWGLLTVLAMVPSCGGGGEPAFEARYVTYTERTNDGYFLVDWFPDESCKLTLRRGLDLNSLSLDPTRHCSQEELAQGEALLSIDAWQTYTSVPCTLLPDLEGPAADENGGPQSTVNYPVGCIIVQRNETKHFDADTTGPEAELIAYFRGLQAKYGGE